MKKYRYSLVAAIIYFTIDFIPATAQTNISGLISSDMNWSIAGSPYIVVGNTLLSSGYTITIDPGVEVKFNSNTTIQIDGGLIAIGTAQNRIRFTSNQINPAPGDWGEIHYTNTSSGDMRYCDVLYGGNGTGSIHIDNSSPYFNHCKISYSSSDGVYCSGAACQIDSSVVSYCNGYGLYFINVSLHSSGLTIASDSIMNNTNGGIHIENNTGGATVFRGNYFSSNSNNGAISIHSNTYYFSNVEITNNYFTENTSHLGGVVYIPNGIGIQVTENYFINNSDVSYDGGVVEFGGGNFNNVECNIFLNNQTGAHGVLGLLGDADGSVSHNRFEGNYTTYGVVITSVSTSTVTGNGFYFTNNIVKNNYCPSGICCRFSPDLSNVPHLHIYNNHFEDNNVNRVVYFTGNNIGNTTNNFLEFHDNNFLDPNSQYELYNDIPSGSPSVKAFNNYWGSTSTQHIDSVIYDFFDNSAKSVVYYSPFLSSQVVVDTSCIPVITGIMNKIGTETNFTVFPNPASIYLSVVCDNVINEGSIEIYNVLGCIVLIENFTNASFKEISIQNIPNGIYFIRLNDGGKSYCKKIIIEH